MKTIGLLGGMSWQSTTSYYQAINQGINSKLGGLHSAKLTLCSVDFAEIEKLQHQGNWQATAEILCKSAKSVQASGADFLLICTNTMHKVAEQIEQVLDIPLLHIADATAKQLLLDGITKVGLLGTQFTMSEGFYKSRLINHYSIDVITPNSSQQKLVHDIIYQELCMGTIKPKSKAAYLTIIDSLFEQGAQAIILGCTEIALLINQADTHIPLYDTTNIHAQAAIDLALS